MGNVSSFVNKLLMSQIFVWEWKEWITLPETNIAPENGWLEYYFPIGMAYFQVRTVSFREGSGLNWSRAPLSIRSCSC